jgi:hypothetical protein
VPDTNPQQANYQPEDQIMFSNPSLTTRVATGKLIGFGFGLLGLVIIPFLWPDSSWMERFGFLFWYTTVGAFIGLAGVYTRHPVLRIPMPWWFSSPLIGAWMNFVLTLLIYDRLALMMIGLVGSQSPLQSPFWFVAEGALVGLVIGYFATRFGGEGAITVTDLNQ